jgi:ubiquinone/menaquinone biosynthesis C-methylase UbiE
MTFYQKTLIKLLKNKIVSQNDRILIVAGGEKDRNTFYNCGFKNVTISNLDYHKGVSNYKPYFWKREDAENLSFKDNQFDWVFVHAGLHHCASPHRALCEMLRVSTKGIGVFESRDSVLNRIANKFNLAPSYEIEPIVLSKGKYGGVRNSHIPNYVYKWTENEVKKTVNSFLPEYRHIFYFYYGLLVPTERLSMSKNTLKKIIGFIAKVLMPIFFIFFKKQGNLFAFVVKKNDKLQPWLKIENDKIQFDTEYSKSKFNTKKYLKTN